MTSPLAPSDGSRRRRAGTALLLLLAALGGEWIVHQLQYLIEYGSHFGAEMASSPHRLYMGPLGTMLALAAIIGLVLSALTLQMRASRRRWLLRHLPQRLHRAAITEVPRVPLARVALIALLLFGAQVAIYLAQENLETLARGASLPGLAVLFSPIHWTVLPLHLLLAVANALILATVGAWLAGSRRALRAVEALVRLVAGADAPVPVLAAAGIHVPSLRLSAGRLGLRSPPLI